MQIILKGDPGSGKTTLVRETAYHWANNNMLKYIKLLLRVNFYSSSLHKKTIKNLYEIITYCSKNEAENCKKPINNLHEIICSKHEAEKCETYFENLEGEGLMIILDNYTSDYLDNKLPTMKHHQFFVDLIQRKIFPKCKLMMTTQSAISLYHLPIKQVQIANIKQIRIAKILGLTSKGRDECLSSPEACAHHLCHNPMNRNMYLWCSHKD